MKLFIPSPACSHCNEVLQGFSSVPWRENRQNWGGLLPFLKERQILRPEGNLPNLAVGVKNPTFGISGEPEPVPSDPIQEPDC